MVNTEQCWRTISHHNMLSPESWPQTNIHQPSNSLHGLRAMCMAWACYLISFWFLSPEPDTTRWFPLSLLSLPLKGENWDSNYKRQNQNSSIPSVMGQKPRGSRTDSEPRANAHTAVNRQVPFWVLFLVHGRTSIWYLLYHISYFVIFKT